VSIGVFLQLILKPCRSPMVVSHSLLMMLGFLAVARRSTVAFSTPAGVYRRSVITRLSSTDEKAPRHDVRSEGVMSEMDPEEMKVQAAFAEHQKNAAKLGWATDIRTLVEYNHGFAVMSTNSKS
jgi:hypothetical protein